MESTSYPIIIQLENLSLIKIHGSGGAGDAQTSVLGNETLSSKAALHPVYWS